MALEAASTASRSQVPHTSARREDVARHTGTAAADSARRSSRITTQGGVVASSTVVDDGRAADTAAATAASQTARRQAKQQGSCPVRAGKMDATQAAIAALVCDSVGTSTQDQCRMPRSRGTSAQRAYRSPTDAQYVGYAVEGWKRQHVNVVSPRGAITADMFEAMLGMLIKERYNHSSVVSGMIFQWGFGLRVGQVRTLTRAQFFNTPQSGQQPATWTYIGPRHKDRSSVSAAVAPEMHRMAPEVLGRVDAFLAAAPHEPGPLFAGHNGREVNAIIKRAAARLGWPKNVKWNGSHCLRHGALVEAGRQGGLELVLRPGGQPARRRRSEAQRTEPEERCDVCAAQRRQGATVPGPVHRRIVRAEHRKKARKAATMQRGAEEGPAARATTTTALRTSVPQGRTVAAGLSRSDPRFCVRRRRGTSLSRRWDHTHRARSPIQKRKFSG